MIDPSPEDQFTEHNQPELVLYQYPLNELVNDPPLLSVIFDAPIKSCSVTTDFRETNTKKPENESRKVIFTHKQPHYVFATLSPMKDDLYTLEIPDNSIATIKKPYSNYDVDPQQIDINKWALYITVSDPYTVGIKILSIEDFNELVHATSQPISVAA